MPSMPFSALIARLHVAHRPPCPTHCGLSAVALLLACASAAVSCGHASPLVPPSGFSLVLGREHPLVGQVYASADHALVSGTRLYDDVATAHYLLLGETHDNRDHHRLQAEVLSVFLDEHAGARVAFEMLDEQVADVVARRAYTTPEQLAEQVDWKDSGWPEIALYRPIFQTALSRGAQLVAAHPSAEHVRASMAGVGADEAKALHLDHPLPAVQITAQHDEIREAHCGHANAMMLTAMQHAQTYKDAFMARALQPAPTALIAGRGHVRKDRGVPYYLRSAGVVASEVLSVGFVDVDDARKAPEDYDVAGFDYVVFTPRVSDADPCEQFRKQLEEMRQHGAAKPQPAEAAHEE